MLWSGQYFAFMTWLPQYLVEQYALSIDDALAGYLLPVVTLLVFSLVTGALLRFGLRIGFLLLLPWRFRAWFGCHRPGSATPALGVVSLAVYGMGAGITPACLFALPSAIAGPGRAAPAFGIVMTGRNLGVIIGPVLLAQLFAWVGGWTLAAPVLGAMTILALVIALVLARALQGAKR